MLLSLYSHNCIYPMTPSELLKVRVLDCQNGKSSLIQKSFDRAKKERLSRNIATVSLKDMSIETRRREAKKPLFLIRYE